MSGTPSFFLKEKNQYIKPNDIKKIESLIELIIKKSQYLHSTISEIDDHENKELLKQTINKAYDISKALQNIKEIEELQKLCHELKRIPETLSQNISKKNPINIAFNILAYTALAVIGIAVAFSIGHLMYEFIEGYMMHYLRDIMVSTFSFGIVPFGLLSLFSFGGAAYTDQENSSVSSLWNSIDELEQFVDHLANSDEEIRLPIERKQSDVSTQVSWDDVHNTLITGSPSL